jgi:Zn-dependent M28 family amino/carboxypeptidase
MGLQGARAFMAAPPIPRARMRLNINFDMVSRSAAREIYIAGAHHRPELKTTLTPVASRALVTVLFGHDQPSRRGASLDDWTMQSDHGVFHGAGIPFVYFGVEDHPDYHRPTDTASRINATFFHQVASMILDAVTTLDRALPKPQP